MPSDIDFSHSSNIDDYFEFLILYFAGFGEQVGDPDYHADIDADRDGQLTIDDYFLMLGVLLTDIAEQPQAGVGRLSRAGSAGPDNTLGRAGYHYCHATGLYGVRFRDFDVELGRWVQRDPIGPLGGSLNYYLAMSGSPIVYSDSLGLIPKDHPIPLKLGGSPDQQLCFDAELAYTKGTHNDRHMCLARRLGLNKLDWDAMADAFRDLPSDEARRQVIRGSLIDVGVDPKVLTDQVMDGIFNDCQVGVNRSGGNVVRKYPVVIGENGRVIKGTLGAFAIAGVGISSLEAAAAVGGVFDTNPSCRRMIDHTRKAFANQSGPCSADCNELARARDFANDCALAVAEAAAGAGLMSAAQTWKQMGDQYQQLVEECDRALARCAAERKREAEQKPAGVP